MAFVNIHVSGTNFNKALMINVKAQLMERDAIFVQLLANYLKCNAIELLR